MDLACNYLVKYSVLGGTSTGLMMGGTGGHTGGTEVCVGGRTGVGGESIASCINYTGKKPRRTQKLSAAMIMTIMK